MRKSFLTTAAVSSMSMVLGGIAQAAVIVDWDGNNSSYTGTFKSLGSLGGTVFGTAFDDTNPQVSGATGTSSTWFGGMTHSNSAGGAYNYQSSAAGGGYATGIHHRLNGSGSGEAAALAYWKNADFLNGLNTPVTLDADSEFKIAYDNLGSRTLIADWVIETSAGFFTSPAGFVNPGNNSVLTDDDLSDNIWRDYAPSSDLFNSSAIASPDLTDVIGVGYRLTASDPSGTLNLRSRVGEFEVTAVPEPASMALAGVGGLMLLARRRK